MSSTNSLLICLSPIIRLSNLLGVLPCRILWSPNNVRIVSEKRDLVYSIIFAALLSAFFQWAIVDLLQAESWKKLEVIASLAGFGQIYGIFFVSLIAMLTGWLYRWRTVTVIQRISCVDQRLLEMDIGFNYQVTRRRLLIQLMGLSIVPIGASMVNCFVINKLVSISLLCYVFICFLPIAVITLKEFQYFNAVCLIRNKIIIINNQLLHLNGFGGTNFAENQSNAIKDRELERIIQRMRNFAKIHAELMDILKEIQTIFGPHLLASILTAFGVITTQLYYLVTGITRELDYNLLMILMTTTWVGIQFLLIMVNVIICAKTSDTISDTGALLHNIPEAVDDPKMYRIVQLFSMQILQRKGVFTAAGFFKLDYKLITSMIAAVLTYLVVMIQFHDSTSASL